VSSQSSQIVRRFINTISKFILFVVFSFMHVSVKAWTVDMSRRTGDLQRITVSGPTAMDMQNKPEEPLLSGFSGVFQGIEPTQEIVILNTDKGFVPETVKVKAGQSYKFHVVNVNETEKNVSFILDAFSEHHGTYFGQPKSFQIAPKIEGVFSFQCPETAKQGKIVVVPPDMAGRSPASR